MKRPHFQEIRKIKTSKTKSKKKKIKINHSISPIFQINQAQVLLSFWETLNQVTQLRFYTKTKRKEEKGWKGQGQGQAILTEKSSQTLIFNEKGVWKGEKSGYTRFSNAFRWSLNCSNCTISLEHLRRGIHHPVFLFYLAPSSPTSLSSIQGHLCKKDCYFGHIHFTSCYFHLTWKIVGPKKNEEIRYLYF